MLSYRKHIRIFVASPGDVLRERDRLSSVVQELSTTIAPYKGFSLELVRWETHCMPALGRPQGVINAQIGLYDIFVGIMWKRFGSPTGLTESGTEEKFRVAYDTWRRNQSPSILFYFCQHPFMPRNIEELEQCKRVLAFRQELEQKGLIWEYPEHDTFADIIRPHLVRLLLDTTYAQASLRDFQFYQSRAAPDEADAQGLIDEIAQALGPGA